MLTPLEFKNLKNVEFPVYVLPNEEVTLVDGLLLFEDSLVIDDRNQPGKTIGIRRLQTSHTLQPLKKSYISLEGMLMSSDKYFVDNFGRGFQYIRTKFEKIKFQKILKVIYKDNVSLLKCSNVSDLLPIRRPPPPSASWVGILYLGDYPWTVVKYSEEREKDTKKKI